MAKDAVETIVARDRFEAEVLLVLIGDDRLIIGANDERQLFASVLRQQRGANHLSARTRQTPTAGMRTARQN
jgi:hypothetical protein